MDKPFFTNLLLADQVKYMLGQCGFAVPEKLPGKGAPPLALDFTKVNYERSCDYGEVEWTEHKSDTGQRLYRYSLWKEKPVALPTPAKNGYICFYNGKQIEVHADTLFAAKEEAVRRFKPPKSKQHMVHCHLAEKDGKAVIHDPASLG